MITTDRDVSIGAHVTESVKEALREAATQHQMSMSAFIFHAVIEKLRRLGISIDDQGHREAA